MIRFHYFWIILFSLCFLVGCSNTPNSEQTTTPTVKKKTVAKRDTTPIHYPSISDSIMLHLWQNSQNVDVTFYQLPVSMTLDNSGAIRNVLKHIEKRSIPLRHICKPSGKMFFQAEGELLAEAEFYIQKECRCYTFFKDGKAAYSNRINDKGLEYFSNIVRATVQSIQEQTQQ